MAAKLAFHLVDDKRIDLELKDEEAKSKLEALGRGEAEFAGPWFRIGETLIRTEHVVRVELKEVAQRRRRSSSVPKGTIPRGTP
jgi:hypothetical protein